MSYLQSSISSGGGGSVAWGSITGTLSSQTDLNTALAPLTGSAYSYLGNSTGGSATVASNTVPILGTPSGTFAPTAGTLLGQFSSNVNNFSQFVLQNNAANAAASTDLIINSDTATETTAYLDIGKNSSLGGGTPFSAALDSYVYTTDSGLRIGALGTSGSITLYTGGGIATPTLGATLTGTNLTVVGTIAGSNLSLANTFTTSGNFTMALTATAATAVTLPTTGTLAALGGTNTWTGVNTYSQNGASSASAVNFTGTVFTGTGTTATPLVYINSGVAPSTFSTAGTYFGLNSGSGFTGNFADFHLNGGASVWSVASTGAMTTQAITCTTVTSSSRIASGYGGAASTAVIQLTAAPFNGGNGTTNFPQLFLQGGGTAQTNWSNGANNGTCIGILQASAFTGNFLDCRLGSSGTAAPAFLVTATGATTIGGSLTTAAPNTGTAGSWKLGILVTTTTVFDTTKYIQLDVGGTLYKLATCT